MTQEHLLNLIWFRSDLRVYDNPALSAAMSSGPSIAVYVISEETWDAHNESPAKRSLILRQLEILSGALSELNVPFYVLTAESMQKLESSIS
ncbi:deoxyribodipyrimidine photo-lyase, partial [Oleiphilus sp. HI0132]